MIVITRVCYIGVLFPAYISLLLFWAEEYYSLQWGLHYMGVHYIKVPLYMESKVFSSIQLDEQNGLTIFVPCCHEKKQKFMTANTPPPQPQAKTHAQCIVFSRLYGGGVYLKFSLADLAFIQTRRLLSAFFDHLCLS